MDMVFTLALGSIKALLLLTIAAGISLALRGRPARLRAVVWGTALVGTLLIPVASFLMPALPVVMPVEIPQGINEASAPTTMEQIHREHLAPTTRESAFFDPRRAGEQRTGAWPLPDLDDTLLSLWALFAFALLARQVVGHLRTIRIIGRATAVSDQTVLELADDVRAEVGCRISVRLVSSDEIDIPAVFGLFRPVVILPGHADAWLEDRLMAVFQHELTHVARYDWPVRITARIACAVYWFNPLAWWAVRRLDLEQEMACDEEVLSLGSRPSSYACHLLGIARTAVHRPTFAISGLQMARRSDLEERIMRILKRPKHRKVGLAVILPAAILTAALVPAIAAVQPTEPGPRAASPELRAAVAEMREAEKRIEPYIERITEHEHALDPHLATIEALEIEIDHEAMARIETEMEPILAQIESIEIDMEPIHAKIEAMHETFETVEFHIEDGTLSEIQEQIHEQMELHHAQLETIHIDLEPYHEHIEALHAQLEPLHEKMEALHLEAMPSHEEMERIHIHLEPLHEEIERIHEEMEPLHEEMERLGNRIELAIENDVAAVLRSHLGPVTSPEADFVEAAARIVEEGNLHIHDDVIELDVSQREAREILSDLFTPVRLGTQDSFDRALEAAADDVSDLEILAD